MKSEFFKDNRRRLKEVAGTLPIVITANGRLQKSADSAFGFRQDSNFWYLTGINEPDVILVIEEKLEYLILPKRDERLKVFEGDTNTKGLSQISGIKNIYESRQGWQNLSKTLKSSKKVATLDSPPAYIEQLQLYTNPARQHLINKLKSHNSNLEITDLRNHISELRQIKQPEEIEAIKCAIEYTGKIFELIHKNLHTYKNECEIEADVNHYITKNQLALAYPSIIAADQNSNTLHYDKNNSELKPDSVILLDIGASYSMYNADITRTFLRRPNDLQKSVYKAVDEARRYAIGLLKPGVKLENYEEMVEEFIGQKLVELGLSKKANRKETRRFYPHRASHFLGLDAHDPGDYESPLKPGMVLTVEPGIYLPNKFGVRIEDNVLITKTGNEVLSDSLLYAH